MAREPFDWNRQREIKKPSVFSTFLCFPLEFIGVSLPLSFAPFAGFGFGVEIGFGYKFQRSI
jgi:hypothetical protein